MTHTSTNKKKRPTHVVPVEYFQHWRYNIHSALWPALGVTLREYIDKEKTKALRVAKKASGTPEKELLRFKIMYKAHVVSTPPAYDFHEGDIFYSSQQQTPVQVISTRDVIEVHSINPEGRRSAFHVSDHELAAWLETGEPPLDKRITFTQSTSEALRFFID